MFTLCVHNQHLPVRHRRLCPTGVNVLPLGIVSWYELQLPVRVPADFPLTAEDRVKSEQSIRFGTSHLAVFVLCYAPDDTLHPDEAEIAEAKWVPPLEYEAAAHAHEGALVRHLRESGKLAAAARLAQLKSNESAGDTVTGTAAAAAAGAMPDEAKVKLIEALEASASVGLMQGFNAQMRHKRYPCNFDAWYYSACTPSGLLSAIRASPQCAGASQIGLTSAATLATSSGSSSGGTTCCAVGTSCDSAVIPTSAAKQLTTTVNSSPTSGPANGNDRNKDTGGAWAIEAVAAAALVVGVCLGVAASALMKLRHTHL